jgi:hypothetical protein
MGYLIKQTSFAWLCGDFPLAITGDLIDFIVALCQINFDISTKPY